VVWTENSLESGKQLYVHLGARGEVESAPQDRREVVAVDQRPRAFPSEQVDRALHSGLGEHQGLVVPPLPRQGHREIDACLDRVGVVLAEVLRAVRQSLPLQLGRLRKPSLQLEELGSTATDADQEMWIGVLVFREPGFCGAV